MDNSSLHRPFQYSLENLFGLLSVSAVFAAMLGKLPPVVAIVLGTFSLYMLGVAILDVPLARFTRRVARSHGRDRARFVDCLLILGVIVGMFVVPIATLAFVSVCQWVFNSLAADVIEPSSICGVVQSLGKQIGRV